MARTVQATRRVAAPAPAVRPARYFQSLPRGDANARVLLLVTALLVAFGTVAVASASEGQAAANGGSTWSIMVHDLVYLVLGLFVLYGVARVRIDQLVRKAPLAMTTGLALLVAVKVVGVTANGGKRWLNFHVINLQPSELFKFCTVLFVAWIVQHHHNELNHWKQLALWSAPVTIGAGLVVLEPDIGTSSVVLAIAFVMLAVAGLSRRLLVRIAVFGIAVFGGYMAYKPYSAQRFFSFLHPNQDLLGSGYQLLQSKIGLGAGGLTGLGLGHSREKWGLLPNPHTDFIFTIIGEELGLIGTLCVLGLFLWFMFVALRIAQRASNRVYQLIAVGITSWIMLEAIINIASVVGWWAVTGIPLPFFSYGGTALITELAAVGLLYNIAHDTSRSGDVTIREHVVSTYRDVLGARTTVELNARTRRAAPTRRNY
ncbi:MAG TPA: putative peptidoglycan glycosyltransferase FtsW [Acidimicrobiales bacterium]|nr:putative peptidoglycan glycosyltransferase FtsW [Acidimicrobiales bacterium]